MEALVVVRHDCNLDCGYGMFLTTHVNRRVCFVDTVGSIICCDMCYIVVVLLEGEIIILWLGGVWFMYREC